MKKITIILILLVLITGCRSTKKATKSNIETKTESVIKTENKVTDKAKEDKNLNVESTTTITETNYYPLDVEPTSTASRSVGGTSINNAPVPEPVKGKGSVKSTKTTVTTTKQTDKGKIETEHKEEAKADTSNKEDTKTKVDTTEKKTVPIPFGWIFGILVIIAGAIIYLKRSNVFAWLKVVLSKVAGFFKI